MVAAASCNSKDDDEQYIMPQSSQVTAFALAANENVLLNLDSVFFSIDQLNFRIFNADSLPKGTRVNRLVPKLSVTSASIVEFRFKITDTRDTTINFIEHPQDTIDFSRGPVYLRVVSSDGQSTSNYTINVNVHKVKADSLQWSRLERSSIPSQFPIVTDAGSAHTADAFYCLSYYDGRYCMAKASDPAGTWTYSTPTLNFKPQLHTLTGTDDALFILSDDNRLMASQNGGSTWIDTGSKWTVIYGNRGTLLLGGATENGRHTLLTYPATQATPAPAEFPVSGASQAVTYTIEMSDAPQTIITGGRTATGEVSGATWGFDGMKWACLSRNGLPSLEGHTVVPYFVADISETNWSMTRKSVLMAMFGRKQDGTLNNTIYISRDLGMHWAKADTTLQTPDAIPARMDARGFVYKQTFYANGTKASAKGHMTWSNVADYMPTAAFGLYRYATKPITEWECPYIYLFGGCDSQGTFLNTVYRGVINGFTFKPLQ